MNCQETKAIMETRVRSNELNLHHTLFGGAIASYMDTTASIAAEKYCHERTVTASIDRLDFHSPAIEGEIIRCEAYVTGKGNRSFEIYITLDVIETDSKRKRKIASAFVTFVLLQPKALPEIHPNTKEEKKICSLYNERKKLSRQMRGTYYDELP